MRRARQPDQQLSSPEKADVVAPQQADRVAAKKLGSQREWHRSMDLEATVMRLPRPPPPRLHAPHRPRAATTTPGSSNAFVGGPRRGANKRRLKRFLPTLGRRVDLSDEKADTVAAKGEEAAPHSGRADESQSQRNAGRQRLVSRPRPRHDNTTLLERMASSEGRTTAQQPSLNIGLSDTVAVSSSAEESDEFENPQRSEGSEVDGFSSDVVVSESSDLEWNSVAGDDQAIQSADPGDELSGENENENESESEDDDNGEDDNNDDDNGGISEIANPVESTERNNSITSSRDHDCADNKPTLPKKKQSGASARSTPASTRHLGRKKQPQRKSRLSRRDQEEAHEESQSEADDDDNDVVASSISLSRSGDDSASECLLSSRRAKARIRKSSPATWRTLETSSNEDEQREPETAIFSDAGSSKQNKKLQARRAELQRLMMQYLGLLQCGAPRDHRS